MRLVHGRLIRFLPAVSLLVSAALVVGGAVPAGARASRGAGALTGVVDATLQVRPTIGPGGTRIDVSGSGFNSDSRCAIFLEFTDASGVTTLLKTLPGQIGFRTHAQIPNDAAKGIGTVLATQGVFIDKACRPGLINGSAAFTVTS